MGLDSFKSNDDDDKLEKKDKVKPVFEEEESNDSVELTGLDSFKTTTENEQDEHWTQQLSRERVNPWMEDFTAGQWNDMTTKEKVKYVRENYYPGYRPEVDLDHQWSYRKVIEVECECKNTFTFRSGGTCMECGRGYKYTGSTVVKKYDPHGDMTHE